MIACPHCGGTLELVAGVVPARTESATYSVSRAAHLLDVDRRTVRRWLERGELPGKLVGHRWHVSAAAVTARRAAAVVSDLPHSPTADGPAERAGSKG